MYPYENFRPFYRLYIKKRLSFPNVPWVQYRDQFRSFSKDGCCFIVQFHPEKAAVLRIRVDAHNPPIEPAFAPPDFGVEKNLNLVADFDFLCHILI